MVRLTDAATSGVNGDELSAPHWHASALLRPLVASLFSLPAHAQLQLLLGQLPQRAVHLRRHLWQDPAGRVKQTSVAGSDLSVAA